MSEYAVDGALETVEAGALDTGAALVAAWLVVVGATYVEVGAT